MFLYVYTHISEGELCVITDSSHPHAGRAVVYRRMEYVMQCPLYVFETMDPDRERVALRSDSQFATVPCPADLYALIDLALQTRDEAWFRELVRQLKDSALTCY